MKTAFFSILIICFLGFNVFAQTSINDYKYVIVPKKYDFLKEPNQYQINALSKFLFEKYGFEAYMEGDELPQDLNYNRCLALNADMFKDSGLFRTKLALVLKNCNGTEIYKGPDGESREKDFKRAYTEATRNAFKPLELLNYKYEPGGIAATKAVLPKQQTKPQEIQELPQAVKAKMAEQKIQQQEVKEEIVPEGSSQQSEESLETLYAQEITNGFQLVDKTPKVVYRMFNTQIANVYLVENHSAMIYKHNGQWVYETLDNGVVVQKFLIIKF
ncbi:hypothetical protein V8G61_02485 [Gaetbulibacter sp. M240]|uniref:hypothetical protein n=1 Tax=Gaetbulibacter sp. M240 TaxID=3126511 RepID=UPI00374F0FB4